MIDGFSVLLPTYQMLPYLKLCLQSLHKHSKLDNQICILVDDAGDNDTVHWLLDHDYLFSVRKHRGAFSGWNECAKKAEKDFFFIAEDDFYFCPEWDLHLAEWLQELSSEYILGANIIEPFPASYIHYDCGSTPKGFNEEQLLRFVKAKLDNGHFLKPQVFSLFAVSKGDWLAIGGYDEAYDPVAMGTRDLQMKLQKLKPRKWVIANDVMIYHFKPQGRIMPYKADQSRAEENVKYFEQKWGLNVEKSEEYLRG